MSYGDYMYDGWGQAEVYNVSGLTVNPLYFTALALAENGYPISEITITDIIGNMYWVSTYYSVDDGSPILDDTYVMHADWDTYTLQMYVFDYLKDQGLSLQGTRYESMETRYALFVYQYYTKLPDDTKQEMQKVIEKEGLDKNSPTIIEDVAQFIRGYLPYSLFTPEYEGDFARYFFDEAETALCRHYATAATAIYRTLGIPARYTVGYVGTSIGGKESIVTADRAHAWVEVYVKGLGWIDVEVTGSEMADDMSGGSGGGSDGSGGGDEYKQPLELRIKPQDVQVLYDPKNPTVYAVNRVDEYFLKKYLDNGYYYEVEVVGQQTGVGVSVSKIVEGSFKMFDRFGNDVTDAFELTIDTGTIAVYGDFYVDVRELVITYDGKYHTYTEYESFGVQWYTVHCPDDYEILFDASSISMRDVGALDMRLFDSISVIVKYKGEVLQNAPKVVFIGSPMRINQRSVIFVAGSTTVEYEEGLVLTNDNITLQKGKLSAGHYYVGTTTGELDEIGEKKNTIKEIVIYDASGVDVSKNYSIEVVAGKLEIVE
jgi:transglutaminase-like putative cysteine protease